MQILIVNSFDRTGGSTVRMRRFYRFFCDLGYDVTYIEANSDLHEQNVISVPQRNTVIGFLIGTVRRILILMKLRYDTLFIQKLAPFTLPLIWMAKLYGKRIIADIDDWDSMLQRSQFMKYLCSLSENLSYCLPDVFVTPHLSLELLLKRKTNKRIYIVPQGVNTELFSPEKYDKSVLRKKYELLEKARIVGFLGCFSPAGIGEFRNILLSMKEVIDEDSNVYLLVIGGGRLLDYYKNLSSQLGMKNIIFTGHVNYNSVPEYISVCDVMTIWMRDEIGDFFKGTLKILEYLSMNKLVVGYLVGETKISFGKYCIQSPPDIQSFARHIKTTLDKIKSQRTLSSSFIEERYSLNTGKDVLREIVENFRN